MKEKEKLLVIGAGGHARSVIDMILQNDEYTLVGCIDNSFGSQNYLKGMDDIPIVGNDEMLHDFFCLGIKKIFVAIGDNISRNKLFDKVSGMGFDVINVISKKANISGRAKLKTGICVMPGACINVNTVIEDNCIINTNCSIDHDCYMGKSVHIAPGVAISGNVRIGAYTQIGTGVCVIDNIVVGKNTFVGGGSLLIIWETVLLRSAILQKLKSINLFIAPIKWFKFEKYSYGMP